MSEDLNTDAEAMFRQMSRYALLPPEERQSGSELGGAEIQDLLPHRAPFLFISAVTKLDREQRIIVARYTLSQSADIFSGHFPGRPVWPGVLHVEAIGQAGILLTRAIAQSSHRSAGGSITVSLTHIEKARFRSPVGAAGFVEIVAALVDDGDPFQTIVGQCLYEDKVCSAAICTVLIEAEEEL